MIIPSGRENHAGNAGGSRKRAGLEGISRKDVFRLPITARASRVGSAWGRRVSGLKRPFSAGSFLVTMKPSTQKALLLAGVLHLAAVALLVGASWHQPKRPPPEPIFDLISELDLQEAMAGESAPAALAASEPVAAAAVVPPPSAPSIRRPEVAPLPPQALPQPRPEPPPPAMPAPVPAPAPAPATPPPATPPPAVVVAPKPPPAPSPERTSYEQFRKDNPLPKAPPPQPTPAPARPAAPPASPPTLSVDADRRAAQLSSRLDATSSNASGGVSSAEQAALVRYLDRLQARIEANWKRPAMPAGYTAEISLTVQPDGSITGVQLLRTNAPEAFVNTVVQAAVSVVPLGPPPHGKELRARFTFRLN